MLDLVMALRVVYFGRGFVSLKCSLFHFCVFEGCANLILVLLLFHKCSVLQALLLLFLSLFDRFRSSFDCFLSQGSYPHY